MAVSVIGAALVNAGAMYVPLLAGMLRVGPISPASWGVLIMLASSVLIAMEAYTCLRRPPNRVACPRCLPQRKD